MAVTQRQSEALRFVLLFPMTVNNATISMQLPFGEIYDNDFFTTNLRELATVNSDLAYQPYRYADYKECGNYLQDLDPVNNHFNNFFPNCKFYPIDNFTASFENNSSEAGLSLIHFNVRSLNYNFEHIVEYLKD